jgi:methionyl aminopeptidase
MRRRSGGPIQVKSRAQLSVMREAGLVTAAALHAAAAAVQAGISTAELDAIAEREIRGAGAVPSFKGYHGYPATICTSVNEQVVHGIPSARQVLADGDVISIDCGAIVRGWHGDAAVTVRVGEAGGEPEPAGLVAACELALWHGLARAEPGSRLTDISHAVEQAARTAGPYGIVREYTGHGIGTQMHMDPEVPNYGRPGRGPVLTEGMALAVEPMLVLRQGRSGGWPRTRVLADGWTVVTADGSWAAHFEHTVAITADGPWVLTAPDGGSEGLAALEDGSAGLAALEGGSAGLAALRGGRAAAAVVSAGATGGADAMVGELSDGI